MIRTRTAGPGASSTPEAVAITRSIAPAVAGWRPRSIAPAVAGWRPRRTAGASACMAWRPTPVGSELSVHAGHAAEVVVLSAVGPMRLTAANSPGNWRPQQVTRWESSSTSASTGSAVVPRPASDRRTLGAGDRMGRRRRGRRRTSGRGPAEEQGGAEGGGEHATRRGRRSWPGRRGRVVEGEPGDEDRHGEADAGDAGHADDVPGRDALGEAADAEADGERDAPATPTSLPTTRPTTTPRVTGEVAASARPSAPRARRRRWPGRTPGR